MFAALIFFLAFTATLAPTPAYAYLDPGSGSMLLQVVLGGFAAIGVMAKLYWHRLTSILRRKERDRDRR